MENEDSFLCPECGGEEPYIVTEVSTVYDPDDPVSAVLEWISCKQCHAEIPAHIAERWNNITIEQAQKEWRDTYREPSQTERFDEAAEMFYDKFGFTPFFNGMSHHDMLLNSFIDRVNKAVEMNDPDIDISEYFPDGQNL
ncbi:MAG: hypothetical protein HRT92_05640 [Piscirickettsiaceae bacterium]|nr:hypothetical protein [Piscirickettsiaceae bacterium]